MVRAESWTTETSCDKNRQFCCQIALKRMFFHQKFVELNTNDYFCNVFEDK